MSYHNIIRLTDKCNCSSPVFLHDRHICFLFLFCLVELLFSDLFSTIFFVIQLIVNFIKYWLKLYLQVQMVLDLHHISSMWKLERLNLLNFILFFLFHLLHKCNFIYYLVLITNLYMLLKPEIRTMITLWCFSLE